MWRVLDLLDETISLAATLLFLLQLAEFERAKRLENSAKVLLCDREVNVSDVEAMERHAIGLSGGWLGVLRLAILFGVGGCCDDGYSE